MYRSSTVLAPDDFEVGMHITVFDISSELHGAVLKIIAIDYPMVVLDMLCTYMCKKTQNVRFSIDVKQFTFKKLSDEFVTAMLASSNSATSSQALPVSPDRQRLVNESLHSPGVVEGSPSDVATLLEDAPPQNSMDDNRFRWIETPMGLAAITSEEYDKLIGIKRQEANLPKPNANKSVKPKQNNNKPGKKRKK